MFTKVQSRASEDAYQLDRLYAVCRRYYDEGDDQTTIAKDFGVSRATISRMLSHAREIGMVQITVIPPKRDLGGELADQLAEVLELEACFIAPGLQPPNMGPGMEATVQKAVDAMELEAGDVVVISSGMATYGISHMSLNGLADTVLVPAVGGVSEPEPWHQASETVRRLARATGAGHLGLFAEAVSSPSVFAALTEDPSFNAVSGLWERAKGALLGIGSPTIERTSLSSTIPQEALPTSVGDVCLHFFDSNGTLLSFPGSERTVHIPIDVLRAIPRGTAVAVGENKVQSIRTAARMKLFTRLVTDEATASLLLDVA